MAAWIWFLLFLASAPLWYSIGVRAERGRREQEVQEIEERAFQRSKRAGTVKLNTVRIRR